MAKQETFRYTYSAKEQEEIKTIRGKYEPPKETEDKMTQLRRLDASVTQKATVAALTVGTIGALILGMGMSLVMTEIGKMIGLTGGVSMLIGILIGTMGMVLVCASYPLFLRIVKKERERIAPEIIRLADELMK